jgi:hypothetical protein
MQCVQVATTRRPTVNPAVQHLNGLFMRLVMFAFAFALLSDHYFSLSRRHTLESLHLHAI